MKKKLWIPIIAAVVLLAVLLIPIPSGTYEDGGTREYTALTYKIVDWSKLISDGKYEKTELYLFPNNFKSIDELWEEKVEDDSVEADILTIAEGICGDDTAVTYAKPVIYLYPEEETEVSVKLVLDGRLTCTYPAYHDGWTVTASPDGTLTDGKGQTYNYLYWEGETTAPYDLSEGFCVKGEDTAAFLEDALAKLGLTRREANEFIVYWLPRMQDNPYNIISFQTDRYTDGAKLSVDPAPDTLIRVFMAWQASDAPVALEKQELSAPERTGFTVIEWGGAEMK